MKTRALRACLKTRPVRAPGLQCVAISAVSCRPRALTRRGAGVFKQALRDFVEQTLIGICIIDAARFIFEYHCLDIILGIQQAKRIVSTERYVTIPCKFVST